MTEISIVRPLTWSKSMVFGTMKYRGSGPFGEYWCFYGNDLTDEEIAANKAEGEAYYQAAILSALQPIETSALEVLSERRRQVECEGYTAEHDDNLHAGDIALAAASYSISATGDQWSADGLWPWDVDARKPTSARRDLVKAGALILAEIDRLDRASAANSEAD